jgi:hypothetical protein
LVNSSKMSQASGSDRASQLGHHQSFTSPACSQR